MNKIRSCIRHIRKPGLAYLVIFLGAFGFFLSLYKYDFFIEDEGLYLYETLRIYKGQLPYRDFRVGYTPLGLYLYSLLFYLFGPGQPVLRIWTCFMNASSTLLLFVLGRRILPIPWAIIPCLLFLSLKPEGYGSSLWLHNTPYFGWTIVFLWLLGVWFLCRHIESYKPSWLFLSGLANGAMFSIKSNAGVYFAWLILLYLAYQTTGHSRENRWSWCFKGLVFVSILLALIGLFRSHLTVSNLLVFILPLLTIMATLLFQSTKFKAQGSIQNSRTLNLEPRTSLLGAILLWLGGFLIILLPWLLYLGLEIGWQNFVQSDLFQNTSSLGVWYLPFFYISKELLIIIIFLYLSVRLFKLLPRYVSIPLIMLSALIFGLLINHFALPDFKGKWRYFSWQIDINFIYLIAAFHWTALFLISEHLRGNKIVTVHPLVTRSVILSPEIFILMTLSGLLMILQVYPRMDIAHIMLASPATLILMACLLYFSYRYCTEKYPWGRVIALILTTIIPLGIVFSKTFPLIWELSQVRPALSSVRIEKGGQVLLDLATIKFYQIPHQLRDRYKDIYPSLFHDKILALKKATEYIQSETPEGSPLFAFPASAILYFLTNRDNPTKIDYFRPQVVTSKEEKEVVEQLKKTNPPYIVMGNGISVWWLGTEKYYPLILDYIRSNYFLEKRFGEFDILKKRGYSG